MSIQELRLRQVIRTLRQDQAGAVVREHPLCGFVAAVEMLAENHLVDSRQHGECAEVDHLTNANNDANPGLMLIEATVKEIS